MFFKVDYEKVSETSDFLIKKTDELNSLYLEIVDICKSVNDNWQSEDSTVYVSKIMYFLKDAVKQNEKLYNGGVVLKRVASRYAEQDNKWVKDLMRSDIVKGKVD